MNFTMEELDKAIKTMKSGKSPGPDQLGNELFIAAGTELRKSILNMYNYFWENETLPDELYNIHIKSLYKGKGATSDLGNQRGIFISNAVLQIYEKMI